MSSKFFKTLLLAAIIVGGIWILVNRDRIRQPGDVVSVLTDGFSGWSGEGGTAWTENYQQQWGSNSNSPMSQVGVRRQAGSAIQNPLVTNVIRIGSFKLNSSITEGPVNASIDLVADICRRYDAIAFQEVSSVDNSWLAQLTDRMNAMGATGTSSVVAAGQQAQGTGTSYSFVSDREQNVGSKVQSAIVYNRATLELDQSQWYNVNDPDNLLSRKPIVAWFRARGPEPERALTFTLANLKINPARSDQELMYLAELFRAIRNDGRGEDDVLIVGDFNAGDAGLQPIRKLAGLTWVVSNKPTDTEHKSQFDNLVFSEAATVEFTGRGGVFDFMRFYNLRLDDALSISEHMPVWAEFSIIEGRATQAPIVQGTPGRVAGSETDLDAVKVKKKR